MSANVSERVLVRESFNRLNYQGDLQKPEHRRTFGNKYLAETEGFEPSMQFLTACSLSRGVPSTTRPRLRCGRMGRLAKPAEFSDLSPCGQTSRFRSLRDIASIHRSRRGGDLRALASRRRPSWRSIAAKNPCRNLAGALRALHQSAAGGAIGFRERCADPNRRCSPSPTTRDGGPLSPSVRARTPCAARGRRAPCTCRR